MDESYRMITRGSDDNFFYRLQVRIQYSPDGEPIVDRVEHSTECR